MNYFLRLMIVCSCMASPLTLGEPFEAGLSALERGHYATAMRAWLKLARSGVAEAQNNVGHMYEEGYGVSQNYAQAMIWYKQAAEQGLPEAQHNVGMLYYHGYGTAQNYRVAISWFNRAAQSDLADSQYMLGLAYHQFMLAFMLQAGDGGDSEPFKALVWAELARRNGKMDTADISGLSKLLVDDEDVANALVSADRCLETNYEQCPQ